MKATYVSAARLSRLTIQLPNFFHWQRTFRWIGFLIVCVYENVKGLQSVDLNHRRDRPVQQLTCLFTYLQMCETKKFIDVLKHNRCAYLRSFFSPGRKNDSGYMNFWFRLPGLRIPVRFQKPSTNFTLITIATIAILKNGNLNKIIKQFTPFNSFLSFLSYWESVIFMINC